MNVEWKQKWLEALRSGKYQQGQQALRPAGGDEFCCLGVLCDVYDNKRWSGNVYFGVGGDSRVGGPPLSVANAVELTNDEIDTLVRLNDAAGASFAEIANYIENAL